MVFVLVSIQYTVRVATGRVPQKFTVVAKGLGHESEPSEIYDHTPRTCTRSRKESQRPTACPPWPSCARRSPGGGAHTLNAAPPGPAPHMRVVAYARSRTQIPPFSRSQRVTMAACATSPHIRTRPVAVGARPPDLLSFGRSVSLLDVLCLPGSRGAGASWPPLFAQVITRASAHTQCKGPARPVLLPGCISPWPPFVQRGTSLATGPHTHRLPGGRARRGMHRAWGVHGSFRASPSRATPSRPVRWAPLDSTRGLLLRRGDHLLLELVERAVG